MTEHLLEANEDCQIQDGAIVGLRGTGVGEKVKLGRNCVIRAGSIIYCNVIAGDYFQTGHNATIREYTSIGDHVVVGTNSVVDGNVNIGSFVKIESNCYIPTHVSIGSRVFFGPGVVLTNDKYPLKQREHYSPIGPEIGDNVTLGAGVIVLPGVSIGSGVFVAAGSIITKDIPPNSFVVGSPARIEALPEHLKEANMAISWRGHIMDGE